MHSQAPPCYQLSDVIHSNVVLQELGNSNNEYWNINSTAIFDVGLAGLNVTQEDTWIIDSDYLKHVTKNSHMISNLEPHTSSTTV